MWSETYGPRLLYAGLGLAAGALAFAKFQPREESYVAVATKVETRVEFKEKEVVRWKEKLVSKVVTKPDGTRVESTTTSRGGEQTNSTASTQTKTTQESTLTAETRSSQSRFVLGVSHRLPPWSACTLCFQESYAVAGARLGSLPLWVTVQNPLLSLSPSLGLLVEF